MMPHRPALNSLALAFLAVLLPVCAQQITSAPATSAHGNPTVLGIVTVRDLPQDQPTSATVVTDPQHYSNVPGLRVMTVEVPAMAEASSDSPTASSNGISSAMLSGVIVNTPDGRKQKGDTPLVWVPTANQVSNITLSLISNLDQPIGHAVLPAPQPLDFETSSNSISMPAVATPGTVLAIHGGTSGDISSVHIAIDDGPVQPVAARPGQLFFRVPKELTPGLHTVRIVPGPGMTERKLPLCIFTLQMSIDQVAMHSGQSTRIHVRILGLDQAPASIWHPAQPWGDVVDLNRIQSLVGNTPLPKPDSPATILLTLQNKSPQIISLSHGANIVLMLHQSDFAHGPYEFHDKAKSLLGGAFDIEGEVTAFIGAVSAE